MVAFPGFDLNNADSIRRLAVCLRFCKGGGRDFSRGPILKSITNLQRATVEDLVDNRMTRSPQLTKIICNFIDASLLIDDDALAAGRRLKEYEDKEAYHEPSPTAKSEKLPANSEISSPAVEFPDPRARSAGRRSFTGTVPTPTKQAIEDKAEPQRGAPAPRMDYRSPAALHSPPSSAASEHLVQDEDDKSPEILNSEDEDIIYYDSDGNPLEGDTIVVEVPADYPWSSIARQFGSTSKGKERRL